MPSLLHLIPGPHVPIPGTTDTASYRPKPYPRGDMGVSRSYKQRELPIWCGEFIPIQLRDMGGSHAFGTGLEELLALALH